MRYLFPPTLNTVRSPTNDAAANDAFRSLGLRQSEDSIASPQRHITAEERGSCSMNSRILFSVTILNYPDSHNGNLVSRETISFVHSCGDVVPLSLAAGNRCFCDNSFRTAATIGIERSHRRNTELLADC